LERHGARLCRQTGHRGFAGAAWTCRKSFPEALAPLRRSRGMKTKAAVLYEAGQPAVIEEITLDPPRLGEVLVRMEAAGVCRSDLHVRDGAIPEPLPIVLGHEGTGVVTEVGPGVGQPGSLQPGERVVLTL